MQFKDWLQLALSCLTLLTVIFSAIKIINKNEREWILRDAKLNELESDVKELKGEVSQMLAVETSLSDISKEVVRMRDRLDRFLDVQSFQRVDK